MRYLNNFEMAQVAASQHKPSVEELGAITIVVTTIVITTVVTTFFVANPITPLTLVSLGAGIFCVASLAYTAYTQTTALNINNHD
ncbi:MAG: hypothetical protein JSS07_06200 [Proteobacteria bacterium]|nr:hypothetical protein [Pseudomonadota bacterium]